MGVNIGCYNVRRAVQIQALPQHVWHEFYDARRMSAWFSIGHNLELYEPGKDGRVELSVQMADGELHGFGGHIIAFDEAKELSFENNWFGQGAWPVPTIITIRLTSNYDGTMVELFHHGFERLGKSGADQLLSYESAWDTSHLAALKKIVEGP
ncbi:MAG: SRPBCC domain-containing protein [Gammaproteobacteria bacterium]|jgi:uncharacterized protein YndB with AHSA1/START domain|nr:SRPBCC domain-containing protein [Gammaproteobacteria bacterium]MBT4493677.1 SRPBCC domain-containing protein [Gammaproteobacteria bacterium]MBT7371865.1 SRPBCC domain-containing protein [Gammaproteobacteria bacterium]